MEIAKHIHSKGFFLFRSLLFCTKDSFSLQSIYVLRGKAKQSKASKQICKYDFIVAALPAAPAAVRHMKVVMPQAIYNKDF